MNRTPLLPCSILFLCINLLLAREMIGAEKKVEADGVAVIRAENIALARDQSLENALRKAVEQAVGTLIEAESMVENFVLIRDEIYTHTQGYVRGYHILRERREGKLFRITLEATVDIGGLEKRLDALGLLYRRVKKPRIMVIILEDTAGVVDSDPAAETAIIQEFLDHGIRVIDRSHALHGRQNSMFTRALNGDIQAIARLGAEQKAELLIIGRAFSKAVMGGKEFGGLISARAQLEARILRAQTGEVLSADSQFASGVDIETKTALKKALAAVGKRWAKQNLPQLVNWLQQETTENSITLIVYGLTQHQLGKFASALKERTRWVKDVQQRNYSNRSATLTVDLKGSGQLFADSLVEEKPDGFEINIRKFSPYKIEMKVRRK